ITVEALDISERARVRTWLRPRPDALRRRPASGISEETLYICRSRHLGDGIISCFFRWAVSLETGCYFDPASAQNLKMTRLLSMSLTGLLTHICSPVGAAATPFCENKSPFCDVQFISRVRSSG